MLSLSGRSHISELTFSCSPYGFVVLILTGIFLNKSDLPLNNHNKFQHLICFDLDAQQPTSASAVASFFSSIFFYIFILMLGKYCKSF